MYLFEVFQIVDGFMLLVIQKVQVDRAFKLFVRIRAFPVALLVLRRMVEHVKEQIMAFLDRRRIEKVFLNHQVIFGILFQKKGGPLLRVSLELVGELRRVHALLFFIFIDYLH